MVCLDTSVLVALLRKDEKALSKLRTEASRAGRIATTVVNLCELYAGAYASTNPSRELEKVERLISQMDVLELKSEASRRYGELVNQPVIRARPIGDFDLIIAAIALSHDESISTRNLDHFRRVPGLVVEAW